MYYPDFIITRRNRVLNSYVFSKYKIAIFCDSEYFHGKNCETAKNRIKSNQEFWHRKIEGNIKRDNDVNERLRQEGWTVLRFWGDEIKKNIELCVLKISEAIMEQQSGYYPELHSLSSS
jgi:DNA mismatch endonuclease (patch repair protein)